MEAALGTLFSGLILHYFPIQSDLVKMQIGIVFTTIIGAIFKNWNKFNLFSYFSTKENHIIIESLYQDDRKNPVYHKIEEYILDKFSNSILSNIVVPKEGSISLLINNKHRNRTINDKFEKHCITISFGDDSASSKESDNKVQFLKKSQIILKSKTASQDIIKKYIINICNLEKIVNKTLTVWRPCVETRSNDKSDRVSWECTKCKTNKTFKNTIVSKKVEKELFEDIDWFIKNDEWFSNKGLPYKRGYVLHGPPGTGKTSIIKSIANNYNLDIFSIDFETIKTNHDLINMIIEINLLSQNKKYILSFEDLDRSDIWKERYYRNDCSVTKDCLLNVIDGIMESYGRLLIITCNDVNFLQSFPAICRPGRIDKSVKIDYCDSEQTKKMINQFYNIDLKEDPVLNDEITPAQMIKIMQQHPYSEDFILENIKKLSSSLIDDTLVEKNDKKISRTQKNNFNNNSITSIKYEIKKLNSAIKREERIIKTRNKKMESNKKKLPKLETKLEKVKLKDKEKKMLISEKNKKERKLQSYQIKTRSMTKK